MSDLVEALRALELGRSYTKTHSLMGRAADEIERLTALMCDAGASVVWTTWLAGGGQIRVLSADGDCLPIPLDVNRFGEIAQTLLAGPCTLTLTAELTEAESEAEGGTEAESKPEPEAQDSPACEVCGEPARHAVQDATRNDNPDDGSAYVTFARHRDPHYFCDEHQREPEEINVTSWGGPPPPEAESPKWNAPSWCKDDGGLDYSETIVMCEEDGKATRDDCDGCAYYTATTLQGAIAGQGHGDPVVDDDTSPVLSDVARLNQQVETLSGALATLRTDHENDASSSRRDIIMLADKLSCHDMAIAKLAEVIEYGDEVDLDATGGDLRAAISKILTVFDPPAPVEFAVSVEPAEPKTRTVWLFGVDSELVGKVQIHERSTPDLIPFGGRRYKPRHSGVTCGYFDDIEKGADVVRPII